MFEKIGQIASMMKNLPKMQAAMAEMQQQLAQLTAEGNSGGGMVTAKVNGRMEVVGCTISEEAMKLNDREMLEDLVMAAVNQAISKMTQLRAEEAGKLAASLGLPPVPPGSLPGMV